jgi:tetratricopeptide (TPR) repeat protein/predicted Ser/Thr protein kinase/TolB-like protein
MPESIAHYRVIRKLGAGAMGEVYLAHDDRLDREVAVKLLPAGAAASEEAKLRFQQEAKAASALNHPNILTIYDVGSDDGHDYIVMEYVEGRTLRDRIDVGQPMDIRELTSIGTQLASALARAHKAGIVHRDLKPENIMIRPDGYVKILDFGLAKLREKTMTADTETAAMGSTLPGVVLGTPRYMSPEQARGLQVDHRADLFSLGCVIYEMASGQPPFRGESAVETMNAIINSPAASLTGRVPPELERVIGKCIEKVPDDRYQHADDIEVDLRRVRQALDSSPSVSSLVTDVAESGVSVPPVGAGRRHGWGSRLWKIAGGVLVLAAAVIAVLVIRGGQTGAATTPVTVIDEEGREIRRQVPTDEHRRRIAILPFDATALAPEDVWLSSGLAIAVNYDLLQNHFIQLAGINDLIEGVREAGIHPGQRIPLTLQKKLASEDYMDHFLSGSVAKEGDAYIIQTRVYETRTGKEVSVQEFQGTDIFGLVDEISLQAQKDMGLAESKIAETTDLPIKEILTANVDAFRLFSTGLNSLFFDDDWTRAISDIEAAIDLDPAFAAAQVQIGAFYAYANEGRKAEEVYTAVMNNLYKLPERLQLAAKSGYYELKGDPSKRLAVVKMWTELYPDDILAHLVLGRLLAMGNQTEEAIAAYKRILELDPKQANLLHDIGDLHRQRGAFAEAESYYRRYADQHPTDIRSFSALGDFYFDIGDYDRAQASYEKCLVLEPNNFEVQNRLATIQSRLGFHEDALEVHRRALGYAKSSGDSSAVFFEMSEVYETQGRIEDAIQHHELALAIEKRTGPGAIVVLQGIFGLEMYVDVGREEDAFRKIEELEATLTSVWTHFIPFAYLNVHRQLEDPDRIEELLPQVESAIDATGFEFLRRAVLHAEARAQELRGNYSRAITLFEDAVALDATRVGLHRHIARCCRKADRPDQGREHLEKVLKIFPKGPKAHYELALLEYDQGNVETALEKLRVALDVWKDADPDFIPVRKAREKLAEWETGS